MRRKCTALFLGAALLWAAGVATPAPTTADDLPHGHERSAPGQEGTRSAGGHVHPAVPDTYGEAHVPAFAWTDPQMLARGKQVYREHCADCHGDRGDGKGPSTEALSPAPPDFRDATMVAEMPGNLWFWRVSEGGIEEPFRSRGSAMPAWKDILSVEDRWAVIAHQHTYSGHKGPHVTSEHPELPLARRKVAP